MEFVRTLKCFSNLIKNKNGGEYKSTRITLYLTNFIDIDRDTVDVYYDREKNSIVIPLDKTI